MASGYIAGLSFGQRQIRMAELLRPGRTLFAMPLLARLSGNVDEPALRAALAALIRRHDGLRASFPLVDGVPVQAVADEIDAPLSVIETGLPFAGPAFAAMVAARAQALVDAPFDLSTGPLARFLLLRAGEDGAALVAVFHHIVCDGASLDLFLAELKAGYDDALGAGTGPRPDLTLQFPDFADWEQESFGAGGPEPEAALTAWRAALHGAPARLDLPYDRRPGNLPEARSAQAELHVPGDVGARLAALARSEGTSEFSLYLALMFAVLRRWSGLEDIVVTLPASRRDRPEFTGMIGLLVDTLPIRALLAADTRFPALVAQVRDALRAAMAHRDLPFERIVEASSVERRGEAAPFLQVLFGAAETPSAPLVAGDGTVFERLPEQLEQEAKADLSVVYATREDGLRLWCRYDSSLFEAETIEAVLSAFGRLAQALADEPDQAVLEVPLLTPADGAALVARFNPTALAYEREASAIDLFFRAAERHPHAPAIEENGITLGYGTLAARVRRLATVLAARGLAAGDVAILALPVSAALIEAQLAVLTLGAAHAPVDPSFPAEQRDQRARSAGARHAVVLDPALATSGCATLDWAQLVAEAETAAPHPGCEVSAQSPAYVMFTSGSTGTPKGVCVPHRAIVRLARARGLAAPGLRAAVYSNPAFDASTLEIWLPLLNGGTLLPVDRTVVMDPRALRLFLAEARVSLLWVTAGLFQQIAALDPAAFAGTRVVITGGDVVNPVAARAVLAAGRDQGLALLNGYGPTENTTFSTLFDMAGLREDELSIPIGAPISNSTAYVLDPAGRPLPPGLVGEIWLGGDGIALGYAGDAALTAERFRPDPFAGAQGACMYRTGDLGRWRADGNIVFLGRADRQVKVRGFRIELGEIEAVLAQHPAVGGAAVLAPRRASGERDLLAYVTPRPGQPLTPEELRTHLEARLPRQMLPHAFLVLDQLPLNANGKVDARALPPVELADTPTEPPLEPRTPEERILARIWGDLLGSAGRSQVGIQDNFFHVGGDSILTIRLVARAFEAGLDIELKDVFEQPTIEGLAAIALRRRRAVQVQAHGARHGAELIAAACDPRNPCRFVSVTMGTKIPAAKVSAVDLGYAIQRLAERHDALRLVRVEDASGRSLAVSDFLPTVPVRFVDVPAGTLDDLDRWIADHSARLARGIDLAAGVTIAATLVKQEAPAGSNHTVVLALHEAVADDRALLLLATELEAALAAGPDSARQPAPALSFSHWLGWLAGHAASPLVREAAMACEAAQTLTPPDSFTATAPTFAGAQLLLGAATSRQLLEDLPGRLGVSLLDALLVALGEALGGAPAIELLDGRRTLPAGAPGAAGLVANLDTLLPLQACAPGTSAERHAGDRPLGLRLRETKMARQRAEPLGLAFSAVRSAFRLAPPTVSLALLPAEGQDPTIRLHPHTSNVSATVRASLTARVTGGRLALDWSEASPGPVATARLDAITHTLHAIAHWAQEQAAPLLTPGDFPLAGLDAATLDKLAGPIADVEDIYPLSPMQEAMLLHSLSRQGSAVNFEQSCMRFSGALDSAALRKAWALVFERHPVLRTVFRWRGLQRPLQLVRRNARAPVELETWQGFSAERLEQRLAQDRAEGFDLEAGPLARLILIRVSASEAYLIASFHHMLADGWCLAQLEREARAAYEAFRRGVPPALPPPARFRDFIAWTSTLERAALRAAFVPLLAGAPAQPALHAAGNGAAAYVTARRQLSVAQSKALSDLSRRRGLTIAALAHLAWGLWTAARRGVDDTVFCTTVSGRPPQVPGIEQMVGLFINNLPVRLRFTQASPLLALAQEMQRQIAALQSQAQLSLMEVAEAAGVGDRASALFDTLLVVENMPAGSDAWAGAGGLRVESVHNALKSAYSLTGVVVPGERIGLSLVLPDLDGTATAMTEAMIAEFAAVLAALPGAIEGTVDAVPLPDAAPVARAVGAEARSAEAESAGIERQAPAPVHANATEAATLDVLSAILGRRLGLTEDVLDAGLTSLGLATVAARLSERLRRPVPVTALIEHRSAAALARALARSNRSEPVWNAVVPLTGGDGEPFICVHPIAGDVSAFLELARAFPVGTPFWALQAPGLEPGQEAPGSVAALASANLAALARRGLPAPRHLGGYSFGGVVAYEMACQLCARGTPPERLVIIDTPAPLGSHSVLPPDPERAQAQWLLRMADVRARHHGAPLDLGVDDLLPLDEEARFALARTRMREAGLIAPEADIAWLRRAYGASRALYEAFLAYAPASSAPRDLPLCLVRAASLHQGDLSEADRAILTMPDMGWSRLNDRLLGVERVTGDHVSMLSGEGATRTAAAIAAFLDVPCPACR
ncbi:amino acid adenylation domain-containing protein [Ancylobacter aquaticus]|uniref:Amino acid adenylation domain-containing protein n=1 Tax=Ancylobacter aquaticus TaxID=100 RepID=A0A4R1HQS4_ANCAQ|nr:non-ribosomal peptide synthetase [Ancylobacter aquaticus]TCK23533.1 amino acid adenylation domain-containing protein [Ancylobacter aquaticus]